MDKTNLNYNKFTDFLIDKLKEHGFSIVFSFFVVVIAFIIIKISKKAIKKAFSKINKEDTSTCKITLKLSKVVTILVAVFMILGKFNISITAFLAVISSSILAFGLSLKDFFCGIAKSVQIFVTKPFSVGDIIEVDSKKGEVKKIDYMNTYMLNEKNQLITIPNALIAGKTITHWFKNNEKK